MFIYLRGLVRSWLSRLAHRLNDVLNVQVQEPAFTYFKPHVLPLSKTALALCLDFSVRHFVCVLVSRLQPLPIIMKFAMNVLSSKGKRPICELFIFLPFQNGGRLVVFFQLRASSEVTIHRKTSVVKRLHQHFQPFSLTNPTNNSLRKQHSWSEENNT